MEQRCLASGGHPYGPTVQAEIEQMVWMASPSPGLRLCPITLRQPTLSLEGNLCHHRTMVRDSKQRIRMGGTCRLRPSKNPNRNMLCRISGTDPSANQDVIEA